jgi:hypothetical protein
MASTGRAAAAPACASNINWFTMWMNGVARVPRRLLATIRM